LVLVKCSSIGGKNGIRHAWQEGYC
jgi:hypothetical protein